MKSPLQLTSVVFLISTIFTSQFIAQENYKTELFLLHQDFVKVDKVEQYEENVKKEIELWKKHRMETTVKYASKSDDNKYNFLTPHK